MGMLRDTVMVGEICQSFGKNLPLHMNSGLRLSWLRLVTVADQPNRGLVLR